MLDFATLLAPVTPDQPSGSLLEYDPAFLTLLALAKGKPEQQMGSSVIPAEPPDWPKVDAAAQALLARTKDLRLATVLAKARLHTAGVHGFFEGIALTRALLERHWETVHPQLDPDDGDDPAMRVNALVELADPETVLTGLRNAELASARGVGRICVRDLERSVNGDGAVEAGGSPAGGKAPAVEAVFSACDRDALAMTAAAASAALADVRAIEAFVGEKVGAHRGPNLSKLVALLQLVAKNLSQRVGVERVEPGGEPKPQDRGGNSLELQVRAPEDLGRSDGAIRSRGDVLLALDRICAYYERFEPSSPIPLLLNRSKRLVAMSFLDIVRDLVPDAVAQVEALRGKQD
jgi:type VI secretion system protein ImpA